MPPSSGGSPKKSYGSSLAPLHFTVQDRNIEFIWTPPFVMSKCPISHHFIHLYFINLYFIYLCLKSISVAVSKNCQENWRYQLYVCSLILYSNVLFLFLQYKLSCHPEQHLLLVSIVSESTVEMIVLIIYGSESLQASCVQWQ